jgi:hypothetical protein
MQPDCYGRLPLHIAMARCRGEEKISLLLEKLLKPHPEAAMAKDCNDLLPLHVGLQNKAEFGLIQPLLELNPSSGSHPKACLSVWPWHTIVI